MKLKYTSVFPLILVAVMLNSCLKDDAFNFSAVKIEGVTPEFAVPLINSELKISELLDNNAVKKHIVVNSDGYLSLIHEDFSYSIDGSDLVKAPPVMTQTNLIFMSGASLSAYNAASNGTVIQESQTVTYQYFTTIEIDELLYNKGDITINVTNNYPGSLSYKATLLDVAKNGVQAEINGGTSAFGFDSKNVVIDGHLADFTGGTIGDFNKLRLKFYFSLTKGISPATGAQDIEVELSVKNDSYKTMKGYFGNTTANLPAVRVPIDIFNLNRGTVTFENPKVKLFFSNDLGLETELTNLNPFNMKLANNSTVNITGITTPFPINPATAFNVPGKSDITLDKSNSNLAAIVNGRPQEFNFGGSVSVNPNGKTTTRNFIADTSKVSIKGVFELPLFGTAKDFGLRDTQDLDLSNLDQEVVEWVELRLNTTNGFPLETHFQAYVYSKTTGLIVDSLFGSGQQPLLPGAITDASGVVITPTNKISDIRVSKDQLAFWSRGNADALIFDAVMTTTKNGSVSVKLFPDQSLKIRVGLRTKLTGKID